MLSFVKSQMKELSGKATESKKVEAQDIVPLEKCTIRVLRSNTSQWWIGPFPWWFTYRWVGPYKTKEDGNDDLKGLLKFSEHLNDV